MYQKRVKIVEKIAKKNVRNSVTHKNRVWKCIDIHIFRTKRKKTDEDVK